MKLKSIKICIILFFGLILGINAINAQSILNLKAKTGKITSYTLSDVAKLTFSAGNMMVNKKDATISTFAFTDIQYLNFGLKTGIADVSNDGSAKLSLFPIPALDRLNMQFISSTGGKALFKIIDLTGKVVFLQTLDFQPGTNTNTFTVSRLTHGLYLCQLQHGAIVENMKFLKD
jgi:hypothetical protein